MAKPVEINVEKSPTVCCGDSDSPHPRIFLEVSAKAVATCPYCGKHYLLKAGRAAN